MLNHLGFDLWADGYDQTVLLSEQKEEYPFAGYKDILGTIFNEVMQKKQSKVLDIGFGTGILTSRLYDQGHQIEGLDFSAKMIAIAQAKMPEANLMEWDFTNNLPDSVLSNRYDSIVSTYALHHLTDEAKISFIKGLIPLLAENGNLFIGDVAFETRTQHDICMQKSIDYWDEEEFYFVYEELASSLLDICKCEFYPISHCGGIIVLSR